MASREHFTDEQWALLRATPMIVGGGVAAADGSGMVDRLAEGQAMTAAMDRGYARNGDLPLFRDLAEDRYLSFASGVDAEDSNEVQVRKALDAARRAAELLAEKASAPEREAYRVWILDIARGMAEAGREAASGARLSEPEERFLAALQEALSGA